MGLGSHMNWIEMTVDLGQPTEGFEGQQSIAARVEVLFEEDWPWRFVVSERA